MTLPETHLHDPPEAVRLARLRGMALLDTPREQEFDRLIAQLADRLGIAHSAFSLVDADRIWFKARHGSIRRQVTRTGSFCTVAITQAEPLIVEDAMCDPRFGNSPHVRAESHLRSYAGVRLVGEDGSPIGTICTMSQQPRAFTPRDIALLTGTARSVMGRLAVRESVRGFDQRAMLGIRAGAVPGSRGDENSHNAAVLAHRPSRPSSTAWQATSMEPARV